MKKWLIILTATACVCRGQESSVDFFCARYSNWVSTVKYPTNTDRIRFVGPLDRGYGSVCDAQKSWTAVLAVDSIKHSVEVKIDMSLGGPFMCPARFAPVYSMAAEFGPLGVGDWVFWSSVYRFTNVFTVYPAPASAPLVRSRFDNGQVHLEWPAVLYLKYEVETSATLSDWQRVDVNLTFDGTVMRAAVAAGTDHHYFRIKRSPILQQLTPDTAHCIR